MVFHHEIEFTKNYCYAPYCLYPAFNIISIPLIFNAATQNDDHDECMYCLQYLYPAVISNLRQGSLEASPHPSTKHHIFLQVFPNSTLIKYLLEMCGGRYEVYCFWWKKKGYCVLFMKLWFFSSFSPYARSCVTINIMNTSAFKTSLLFWFTLSLVHVMFIIIKLLHKLTSILKGLTHDKNNFVYFINCM